MYGQALTVALTEERTKSTALSSDLAMVRQQINTQDEQHSHTLHGLTSQLAETKFQLDNVQQKVMMSSARQHGQSEVKHLTTRLQLSEEQLADARQRLHTAEAKNIQQSHERSLLLVRLTGLEEEAVRNLGTSHMTIPIPTASPKNKDGLQLDAGSSSQVNLPEVRVLWEENSATAEAFINDQAAFLIHSQANFIERCRLECANLLDKWDVSESDKKIN